MYMCACDVCVGELHVYVYLFGCLYFCVLRHPRDCDLDVLMYINLKEETRCYRNLLTLHSYSAFYPALRLHYQK